jgi:hypothetical protein
VKAAAETFRQNPRLDAEKVISELGVGEALVSFLDAKGTPGIVERAFILPPHSQIGPIRPEQRRALLANSLVAGYYEKVVDRESAYEVLTKRFAAETQLQASEAQEKAAARTPARRSDTMFEAVAKSTLRAVGSQLGRQLVRGVLGSLIGGTRRSRRY